MTTKPPIAPDGAGIETTRRPAYIAFVLLEVFALPILLYLGRGRWFRYDEWDYLSTRSATSLHDLFAPHSVHWSTLPILTYRALWAVFGLHSYVPYQAVSILAHLAVAALVRAVMRRAGVRPWTATGVVALLVLFGAGEENVLWAFQIAFTGALAFGLLQLILADHDGPLDRRDTMGLLAGFAGLLCSGLAVTMVVVVGIAVLARRGWRIAAFHTAPLAVAYALWFLAIGHDGFGTEAQGGTSPGTVVSFVRAAVAAAFGRMAQVPGLGWALGALVVVGCFLAWHNRSTNELRRVAAAPVALFVGAFVFLLITGSGRGAGIALASRYSYVVASLVLPAIAIAAEAFMLRWRIATPILALALACAIVGNVRLFDNAGQQRAADFQRAFREAFFLVPRLPIASEMPRDFHPEIGLAPWVTLGWMRDGVAAGRIPSPGAVNAVTVSSAELQLALKLQPNPHPDTCKLMAAPAHVRLTAKSSIQMSGALVIVYTDAAGVRSLASTFAPTRAARYLVAYAPLDLAVRSQSGKGTFRLCNSS